MIEKYHKDPQRFEFIDQSENFKKWSRRELWECFFQDCEEFLVQTAIQLEQVQYDIERKGRSSTVSAETEEVIYQFLTVLHDPAYDYLSNHVEAAHNTTVNRLNAHRGGLLRSDTMI